MKPKDKPIVVPKLKPRNPLGLVRKGTVKHKNKKKEAKENPTDL